MLKLSSFTSLLIFIASTNAIAFPDTFQSNTPAGIDMRYYMTQGLNAEQAKNLYLRDKIYHSFLSITDHIVAQNIEYLEENLTVEKQSKLRKRQLTRIRDIRENFLIDLYNIISPLNGTRPFQKCLYPSKLLTQVNTYHNEMFFDANGLIHKYLPQFKSLAPLQVSFLQKRLEKTKHVLTHFPSDSKQTNKKPELTYDANFIYCADISKEKLNTMFNNITKFKSIYLH